MDLRLLALDHLHLYYQIKFSKFITQALQALRANGRPAATWTAEAVRWPQA
jgi:hypothetical protein